MHSQRFFSFLYLTIFITISASQDDFYISYPFCSPSIFNCGSIHNINYPFWIKGRPENCSYPYPGFTLDCNGDIPEIKIESKIYRVKEIDYGNRTLTIVEPDICSSLLSNSTLNSSIFYYAPNISNLTVYYNCPHPISNPDLRIVPCPTYGNNYSYYMIHQGPLNSYDQFGDCQLSIIPLLDSGVNRLYENLAKFGDVIKDGFSVSWERVDSGNCLDCVSSGGNCGYNQNKPDQPLCYCWGEAYPNPKTCPSRKGKTFFWRIVLGVFAALVGCLLPCVAVCLWHYTKCLSSSKVLERENNTYGHNNMEVLSVWRHPINNVEAFLQSYGFLAPMRFQYSELKKMTNSFKDKLGQGGFGGVFKGQLKDGHFVAVKVLNKSKGNGEEFLNEVASIGRTNHVNIVSLLGFCYEHSIRALIYEFVSNGSLEKFIYFDKSVKGRILECETLIKIAIGIARGLEYLHRGCTTRILHFDIKPHNILLDDNLCPKISDFGLSKLCPEHESAISMHDTRGTLGYIAPEVYCRNIGVVSYKSDVYSYGMMVLEMVAGRKNIDAGVENTSEIYFPHWIYNRVDLQESLNLLGIDKDVDIEIARKMVLVGLWCIQTDPTNRPSMSKVVEMLEGSLENLHMPPKP